LKRPQLAGFQVTSDICNIQVEAADGKPQPNATVVCVAPSINAVLRGTTVEGGSERFQTDVEGRLSLPWNDTNVAVVVANDKGFSLAQSRDLINSPTMVVRPWSRIEGRRINGGQPVVGQRLKYRIAISFLVSEELKGTISVANRQVTTDSEGRFAFELVPPVDVLLYGMQKHPQKAFSALQWVEVEPGKTNRIEVATHGRTVVGQLELEPGLANRIDLTSLDIGLQPEIDMRNPALWPSIPKEFDTPERRAKWWRDWHHTEAGRQRLEMFSGLYGFEVHADGSFVADLIQPGKYWMTCNVQENGKMTAVLREHVAIPQAGTNCENEPFHLGKATIKTAVNLKVGDLAPDFSAMSLDGKPLKLSGLRGKYVLLDFWATWCGPCIAETPHLRQTYDAFGKGAPLEMISLSLDADPAEPKKFARHEGMAWTQGFLGAWSNDKVTQDYGVHGIPAIFLIGPDGKVLATDLRGLRIKEAVALALAR
jgi:thiol-disulfide isomerase/thioredoxin